MPADLPYDAVLCDIDGVLRHWPSIHDFELAHAMPEGAFAAVAFAPARLQAAITGRITDEEWREEIATGLAAHGPVAAARAFVAAWSEMLPEVDQAVAALLTRVRSVVPVALLSNATTRLERDLAVQGLADVADAVVNTSRIGVAKPDRRAFLIAAERVGAPPHRCLFVDDTAANAAAAREVGMIAVYYRQIEDLRRALAPLLREDEAAAV
jgi:putative hydrolase of the HAD superfamily